MAHAELHQSGSAAVQQRRETETDVGGDEFRGPTGRLAYMYNCAWVGILGGEPTGVRGSRKSTKKFALFNVKQKPDGGYDVEFREYLPKDVIERESIPKRMHHTHELRAFDVPGNVRGQRCQLITL